MAQSKRKFYKTVIQVTVLSEDCSDFGSNGLDNIHAAITTGDCSGEIKIIKDNVVMSGKQAAKELVKQGSDPEFFQLTENGEDLE